MEITEGKVYEGIEEGEVQENRRGPAYVSKWLLFGVLLFLNDTVRHRRYFRHYDDDTIFSFAIAQSLTLEEYQPLHVHMTKILCLKWEKGCQRYMSFLNIFMACSAGGPANHSCRTFLSP